MNIPFHTDRASRLLVGIIVYVIGYALCRKKDGLRPSEASRSEVRRWMDYISGSTILSPRPRKELTTKSTLSLDTLED